jgi:hypothetical protein
LRSNRVEAEIHAYQQNARQSIWMNEAEIRETCSRDDILLGTEEFCVKAFLQKVESRGSIHFTKKANPHPS